jgi:hypothetical protein
LYKGRYANSGDIITTFDERIPLCFFAVL